MKRLMHKIFKSYAFEKKWEDDNRAFYSVENSDKTSFFLIDYICATGEEISGVSLLSKLKKLEEDYVGELNDKKYIKKSLQELYKDDASMAAQIDKNTSAIYAIKLNSLNDLEKYRNVIYTVEESPYHFRRYILPYTQSQIDELKEIINEYRSKSVVDLLSEIANKEDAYYNLASHKNLNNAYELVIRLFSKIPFLQYNFIAEQKPMSVERRINAEISLDLLEYHKLILDNCLDVEKYINLKNMAVDDDIINGEISKRLESMR